MFISSSEAKRIGKENLKFQWGASLLVLALYAVLFACGNVIPVLGGIVVSGALTYGITYVYYRASFKEKINYWDIFKGFENEFGDNFLAGVLINLFTFLWALLFIIPGIVKSYAYSLTYYLLMKEPGLDAMEAMHKSCQYMRGHKMRLFMLDLSFLGWSILEVLTGGILAIYVEPYKHHAKMAFYNNLYEIKSEQIDSQENKEAAANAAGIDPSLIVDVEPIEENENQD